MNMKKNLYIVLAVLCAACLGFSACDSEALDPGFHADGDGGQVITVQIPEYPTTRMEPGTGTLPAQWEEGDVIYIQLVCYGSGGVIIQQTTHIAQRTADGEWEFNKPLTVPPATNEFVIFAWYTSGALPGTTITGDLLRSYTNGYPRNTDITLSAFDHYHSRITFTGLDEGDEIEFKGDGWWHSKLDDNYMRQSGGTPASLTADATKNAVLYALIYASDAIITRTYEFRIKPGGSVTDATGYFTFDPGEPNPNDTYWNRTYTIDCGPLRAEGGNTPGKMQAEEEKERFLAWAQSDRWKTEDFTLECNIDLTGVQDFEPIGPSNINYFERTFDGGGYTISGLTVDKQEDSFVGLFGYIGSGQTTGTVRNLTVKGNITGNDYVGGIAGLNNGIISGCNFTGTVTANHTNAACAGGIAGGTTSGTITGCHVWGSTITGAGYVGGITGDLGSSSPGVIACLVTDTEIGGTPGGNPYFGGIAGDSGSRLVACVSAAKTTLAGAGVGSITGENYGTGTLSACYWQMGNGFDRAIGYDWNTTTPQEDNCTGFAAGTFTAEYVGALNAAIEAYNAGQTDDALECKHRWKVSETAGGLPGLETVK